MTPRIQTVIISHDGDPFIDRCLDSLKNQDISVTLGEYDPRGAMAARLRSLNEINMDIDFIAIIDNDDVVNDQFVHNMLKYIDENNITKDSNIVLIPDERRVKFEDDKYTPLNIYRHDMFDKYLAIRESDKLDPFDILHEPCLTHHMVVPTNLYMDFLCKILPYKNDLVDMFGLHDTMMFNYLHALDYDFHFVREAMYYWTIRPTSATGYSRRTNKDKWTLIHNGGLSLKRLLIYLHSVLKDERIGKYLEYGAT